VAFVKNIKKIRFTENDDDPEGDRSKIIEMLYKNIDSGLFFMNRLLIISPDMRPVVRMEETGEVRVDELSKMYQKMIMLAGHLKGVSSTLFDVLSYRMQLMVRDLYEMLKVKLGKKHGLIRNSMLGKRVDYSARAVITPDADLAVGTVGVPLRNAVLLFEPFLLYGFLNSSYADNIPQKFHDECFKFLDKEQSILDI
jgi:DNA-directed RNA polymerase beta' subunit